MSEVLSPLPLEVWRPTRDRLHGWARLAGAVRRQQSPARKHWWHISLLPSARGLTTGPFTIGTRMAQIDLDLRLGQLAVVVDDGHEWRVPLAADPAGDGRLQLLSVLAALGIIAELPALTPAAPGVYDGAAAGEYLRVLAVVAGALRALQAEVPGETSPVQLWPHHFDLAVTWLSGRAAAGKEHVDAEERDESVTVGFSTGDEADPRPFLYAIAYPWPAGVEAQPLALGRWHAPGWSGAILAWSEAVGRGDPAPLVRGFAREAWRALATAQGSLAQRAHFMP